MNTDNTLPATVYDETNGLAYDLVGDYYFPRLTVPEEPEGDIGRYGRMRKKFLKEHQPDTFALMLMESAFYIYCKGRARDIFQLFRKLRVNS